MSNSRSPLAEEYANATETNLDRAKPEELERTSHAEVDKPRPDKRDDEHPLSVGKP